MEYNTITRFGAGNICKKDNNQLIWWVNPQLLPKVNEMSVSAITYSDRNSYTNYI